MRPITKKAVLALVAIVVVLVALGALPGLLKSGDPYYITAEPTDRTLEDENATDGDGNVTMVDAANLSERTYQYTWEALEDARDRGDRMDGGDGAGIGRSSPYWKGPVGFKEAFSHSPFDEMDSLRTRYSATMIGEREGLVRWENQTYRLAVAQP